jgi:hypothetical protein
MWWNCWQGRPSGGHVAGGLTKPHRSDSVGYRFGIHSAATVESAPRSTASHGGGLSGAILGPWGRRGAIKCCPTLPVAD